MRDTTANLAWRAVLAIFLMIAFYVLALAMVALLIAIPFGLYRLHATAFILKVGFFCLVGVFVILKSIVPRPDRFEPPGPRLTPEEQPRLFAEVRAVAAAVKQVVPAEVYLLPDVNAWVQHRGGLMGIGSRRVMGLGLPLLQVLTVPELKAVLAHEFGHFHGGDVAIGPWIYKTRDALVRTVSELHEHSQALSLPFIWYGNHFFRITFAVSRHQETLADRLAAEVVGKEALASGLEATHRGAFAFVPYWMGAVQPVIAAGFVPPLAAGFESFLSTPWVQQKLAAVLAEVKQVERNPYDTHPAHEDRLRALGVDPSSPPAHTGPKALSLVDDVHALELRLGAFLRQAAASSDGGILDLGRDRPDPAPLPWEQVAVKVWVPEWERSAVQYARLLSGVTPASLPEFDWRALGRKVEGPGSEDPYPAADFVVGMALVLLLTRAGFALESHPASERALVGLGERVQAFGIREELAKGPEAVEAWRDLCARAGITDTDLGAACRRQPRSAERGKS